MLDYNLRHGRTYMYLKDKPLYPFGFGLSYTSFKYSSLKTSAETVAKDGTVTVTVDVTNTGARDGDEVVQLYVKHLDSKVERPMEELKGFERVAIAKGQSRAVSFPLKAADLAYWDETGNRWVVEAEPVEIRLGGSSAEIQLTKSIRVVN
jgi:beta-glucosidase